jgi:citrate lyase synthetase
LGRAGIEAEGAPKAVLPELSSSAVRALLREKNWGEVAGLVPQRVLSYIQEHGLYQNG